MAKTPSPSLEEGGDGPDEALRAIGQLFREIRKARNLTLVQLASRVNIGEPKLSLIENGRYNLVAEDARRIARELELSESEVDDLEELLAIAIMSPNAIARVRLRGIDKQQDLIRADERGARAIAHFSNTVVPGLLQTPAYSRALLQDVGLRATGLERAVHSRQMRQRILIERARDFYFVLSQAVLYTRFPDLSATDLVDQLSALSLLAVKPNIHLAVIPVAKGTVGGAGHGFTLYDDRLATAETMVDYHRIAETNELSRFRQIFLQLSHMAVHDTAAVNLIENAILELRNAL